MGWGSGFNCWAVNGPTVVLFLFYLNKSGIHERFRFSSQPLTIPTPGLFSASGGLFTCLNGSTLGDCLPFSYEVCGG